MLKLIVTIDSFYYSPQARVTTTVSFDLRLGEVNSEAEILQCIRELGPLNGAGDVPERLQYDVYTGRETRLIKLYDEQDNFVLGATYMHSHEAINWVYPQMDPGIRQQLRDLVARLRGEAQRAAYGSSLVNQTADLLGLSLTDIPARIGNFQPRRGAVERLASNHGIAI